MKRSWSRWVLAGLAGLLACEVTARALTTTSSYGMPMLRRIALVPFDPAPDVVEDSWTRRRDAGHIVRDPELGWSLRRNQDSPDIDCNAQGLRARFDRVYAPEPAPEVRRILCFGDSFTHGDEVELEETWARRMELAAPDLEVLNFGVSGFGTDQAYLRWRRDGACFGAQIVALGIWPENLCRNVNAVRYYLVPSGGFGSKPLFVRKADGLRLLNSPVMERDALLETLSDPGSAELLAHEHWLLEREHGFRWYLHSRLVRSVLSLRAALHRRSLRARLYDGSDPRGIDVTTRIARMFHDGVARTGARPLVLLLPMRDLLEDYPGSPPLPLVVSLRAAGLQVLDFSEAFANAVSVEGQEALFLPSGHHTPRGHELLAQEFVAYLASEIAAPPR